MAQLEDWKIMDLPNWGCVWTDEVDAAKITRAEFFEEYVWRWHPVVLRGACSAWPAAKKWCVEYLHEKWGSIEVPVYTRLNPQETSHPDAAAARASAFVQGTVANVLHATANTSIRFQPIGGNAPLAGMAVDLAGDPLVVGTKPPRAYDRRRIFLQRGGISLWHYHSTDEHLTYQLVGKKRFAMLGPDQHYTVARAVHDELYSILADVRKYPEYAEMVPSCSELEGGDAIYIPPRWYHVVQPVDQTLGATLAFAWGTEYLRGLAKPWRNRAMWKTEIAWRLLGSPSGRLRRAIVAARATRSTTK
jgi:hypothetical protein